VPKSLYPDSRKTRTNPRDVLVDESKQADIENLGDCLRALGDCLRALGDGQQLGEFSLTIVLYRKDRATLDQLVGEFAGAAVPSNVASTRSESRQWISRMHATRYHSAVAKKLEQSLGLDHTSFHARIIAVPSLLRDPL
jgi:hypothetical protein